MLPHPRNTARAMAMTCWLPEAEAALAQVEGDDHRDAALAFVSYFRPRLHQRTCITTMRSAPRSLHRYSRSGAEYAMISPMSRR